MGPGQMDILICTFKLMLPKTDLFFSAVKNQPNGGIAFAVFILGADVAMNTPLRVIFMGMFNILHITDFPFISEQFLVFLSFHLFRLPLCLYYLSIFNVLLRILYHSPTFTLSIRFHVTFIGLQLSLLPPNNPVTFICLKGSPLLSSCMYST